jgi:hypothetical protein
LTKFVQICASQNDLFALDEEGHIHQYNFGTKTWAQLAQARSDETSERSDSWSHGTWRQPP